MMIKNMIEKEKKFDGKWMQMIIFHLLLIY
jgi:hypothetical protein